MNVPIVEMFKLYGFGTIKVTDNFNFSHKRGILRVSATTAERNYRRAVIEVDDNFNIIPLPEKTSENYLSERNSVIKRLQKKGCTQAEIGSMFDITPSAVCMILKKQSVGASKKC